MLSKNSQGILWQPYQNSGVFKFHILECGFFHQNFVASIPKFRGFQISHTRVWFFYQNFVATIPKFRGFQILHTKVFLFHQNFVATIPKFRFFQKKTCFYFEKETHFEKACFFFKIFLLKYAI